jgi:hypothetical protein
VKVAYALDDMDMSKVFTKQHLPLKDDGGRTVKQKVPVCTSEIRELFRNWDCCKDHVVFFKEFKRVSPPWTYPTAQGNELKLWANYAAQRAKKLQAKYGKTGNELYKSIKSNVDTAVKNAVSRSTVEAFHASKPSLFNPKYALPVDNENHEKL